MAVHPHDPVQIETALRKANRIRTERSQLKHDLKTGRESPFGYIIAPPEFIQTMKVYDLVSSIKNVGPITANQIMAKYRFSPNKKMGDLTERQRKELADRFRYV
jgi:hypothetical protein